MNDISPAIAIKPKSKLTGLEAGRGVAAMLVVLSHGWAHCRQFYGPFPLGQFFAFGHAGVDFFFVLSGFIIFHAHRRDIGRPAAITRYAERRITRIYPLYWIILALTLAAAALSSHPFPAARSIFTSSLLLPTFESPIVDVAWTLQHEMLFYAIFALLILNLRLGLLAFGLWLAYLAGSAIHPVESGWGIWVKLSSYFNLEFFLGMGAAWLTGRHSVPKPRLLVLSGIAMFVAIGLAEDAGIVINHSIFTHLGYGISATALVVGLVAWERRDGLKIPALPAILGSASYSIYLVHILAIGAIWQVLLRLKLENVLPVWLVYLVLVTGAAISGVAVSYGIEKPVIIFVRRLIIPKPVVAVPGAVPR